MPFDAWAAPAHLGNRAEKGAGSDISVLTFPVEPALEARDSKTAAPLDGVNTVPLKSLLLWPFEGGFGSLGITLATETGLCPPLVSRTRVTLLAADTRISYHEV